jgi:LETM1-like protein
MSAPDFAANGELQLSGRARARAYLRKSLRESGLLFGTPAQAELSSNPLTSSREALLYAVIGTFARIALDIASLVQAPPPRREQLVMLFAATLGVQTASEVESSIERRAKSLARDPVYGLVLHNAAVYVDAQIFGRLAIRRFSKGELNPHVVKRLLQFGARQKSLLLEVLTALASADRKPSFIGRRAILRQIKGLELPQPLAADLRRKIKRAFKTPPVLDSIVQPVRSAELRRFILEQTILASLVGERRSPQEIEFIRQLASALRFGPNESARVELEMAEFYANNVSVVDVFRVAAGAGKMGEEVVASIQQTLEKNFNRLMQEVRETGELSVLLTRAARGQTLTREERRKVRAQLIDVAKAIPALAIFAAPGGILLLIALAKVLPFNILPSSFQEEPEKKKEVPAGGARVETVDSRERATPGGA